MHTRALADLHAGTDHTVGADLHTVRQTRRRIDDRSGVNDGGHQEGRTAQSNSHSVTTFPSTFARALYFQMPRE
jgi:hypothetical protein